MAVALVLILGWVLDHVEAFARIGLGFGSFMDFVWYVLKLEAVSFWPLTLAATAVATVLLWRWCVFFRDEQYSSKGLSLRGFLLVAISTVVFYWLYTALYCSFESIDQLSSNYQKVAFVGLSTFAVVLFFMTVIPIFEHSAARQW